MTCSTIDRAGAVGDLGGDLHAAVHRAGVHDDRVRPAARAAGGRRGRSGGVLAGAREERGAHPLALHPQHHHGVALGAATASRSYDVVARPGRRRRPGSSVGGATSVTSAPSVLQQQHVGAGDPAVQHVADDRDPAARPSSPRCRRIVNASSSAWVGCSWVPSPALTTAPRIQPRWRAGAARRRSECRMTTRVGAHRLQGQRGVLEALALGHARALGGEVDDVGATAAWRRPRTRSGCGWSPRRTG